MSENREFALWQKALAEFVGTFSIIFFGAGAVVIDFMTAPGALEGGEYLAGGALGMGALGWVGIALAHLLAVGLPIYVFGHVSGGHINPAVTAAFLALRRIDPFSAAVYVVSQLAGGIVAALLFVAIRGREAVTIGGMGATAPFPGVNQLQAVSNEAVITFFLMLVIMAMAVDDRTPDQLAGLAIGATVAMGILATGNVTGASFNPARTLGPYVADSLFGGPDLWRHAWIYVVGPTAGAITGGVVYEYAVSSPLGQREDVPTADPASAR